MTEGFNSGISLYLHGEVPPKGKGMKIIGINGSPKQDKSQTRRLVMGVLEGARQARRM